MSKDKRLRSEIEQIRHDIHTKDNKEKESVKKSKKTETETRMEELIKECETIVDENYLTTNDAKRILDIAGNLLLRYEEVRKSRDNWKNKYTSCIKSANNLEDQHE